MNDLFVDDLRTNEDPSLAVVPRLTTFDQLVSFFKLQVRRDLGQERAGPGEKYFKLVGFYVRTGIAAYLPKVRDEDESPLENVLLYRHWPGADQFPEPVNPAYFDRGVGGFTNANGDIAFAYAGTSVVGEDGGPDAIWVSADPPGGERRHSDCVTHLGWMGGTDHLTANPIFQAATKAGEVPPDGEHYIAVVIDGQEVWRANLVIESSLRVEGSSGATTITIGG
jgi:hypothetical protein